MFIANLLKEAGLPDGVFNVVHGDKVAVDALLTHPGIKSVSFVGSLTFNSLSPTKVWTTKAKSVNMFAIKISVFIFTLFSDQDVVFAWYYESVKMVCQSVEYYNC